MKLTHIKGHTWCIEDWQKIPVYITDDKRAILIDSGLLSQRQALDRLLEENGLSVTGLLTTHVHIDHSGNHNYYQKKYGACMAVSLGEAAVAATSANYKLYLYMFTIRHVREREDLIEMIEKPDVIIMPGDDSVTVDGITFGVYHTPGHSPDHVSFMTPDGVLCIGDAFLSGKDLKTAKVPYYAILEDEFKTLRQLKQIRASYYIPSHGGIYEEIGDLIEENERKLKSLTEEIGSLIDHPMTIDEIYRAVCEHFCLLSSDLIKAGLYERNTRSYVEYMRDTGKITAEAVRGLVYYHRT